MSTNKQYRIHINGIYMTCSIPVLKDVKKYKTFRPVLKSCMYVMGFTEDKLQRSFDYHNENRPPDQYPYGTQGFLTEEEQTQIFDVALEAFKDVGIIVMSLDNDAELGTLAIYNMDKTYNVNDGYALYQDIDILHQPFDENNVEDWLDEIYAAGRRILEMEPSIAEILCCRLLTTLPDTPAYQAVVTSMLKDRIMHRSEGQQSTDADLLRDLLSQIKIAGL
eukprot:CAMPEP_0203751626 /NCGR_PEP_ID=MMETSP0098-20131031/5667_1 /ASSEMBLY_ACC=CAM_ASM_000208 /TAXON_ID=96639 /ORGANISM=" , Strain NY0313808BC1" /LENGTH=220 /DNA_ID=CAMNT_0050641431 /DNA_START=320 /DNA_END=982 /DNA_ORIENTATION=-